MSDHEFTARQSPAFRAKHGEAEPKLRKLGDLSDKEFREGNFAVRRVNDHAMGAVPVSAEIRNRANLR